MKIIVSAVIVTLLIFSNTSFASRYYSKQLCSKPGYFCIKAKRGDSWSSLFPNSEGREIVRRVNRINLSLQPGMTIAIPTNLGDTDLLQVAPFAHQIAPFGRTTIIVDLSDHAFGAYDAMGTLVHWGPVSGGQGWCPDIGSSCRSPMGNFYVISRGGPGCVSSKFPIGEGGAPMPYCMFFHGGYALHASPSVPGYHASHGCIRLFYEDAEWLNREFVELGHNRTKVIVRP
ncbi:MAG: L,D-transpeptidase [Gammaproteobacteria bacterium]|nr:L,D-transpeptidase [Gammaproteobacteria bacterium]